MKHTMHTFLRVVAVLAGVVIGTTVAQEFEITRSSIDGGGVMRSTGGDFELSSTIGQPDAGAMNGGDFELTGGFWIESPPTDCNDDGIVSLIGSRNIHCVFARARWRNRRKSMPVL